MPKSKNKRKKKRSTPSAARSGLFSQASYIKNAARKLDIYECLMNDDYDSGQLAVVILTRIRKSGDLILGCYMVDTKCLGVKNTLYRVGVSIEEYQGFVEEQFENGMGLNMVDTDVNLAHSVIYGGARYAKTIGFLPEKDFKVAQYILNPVDTVEWVDVDFGGDDGRPFYFAGPYDNPNKIVATLRKSVGEGNFTYVMPMEME